MTSRRRAEPLNIQCLPSSLAETRSIVLLTPNGLLQRMHSNGASSLSTRAAAVAARKSSCGRSVMTFSGQVALHSPHCTQASSAKRSIGRSVSAESAPVGHADTQARQRVHPPTRPRRFAYAPPSSEPWPPSREGSYQPTYPPPGTQPLPAYSTASPHRH